VFLGLGVVSSTVAAGLLQGNPMPVALLLLGIGGALQWTVRAWPDPEDAPMEDPPS